jgi:hypothetical protein
VPADAVVKQLTEGISLRVHAQPGAARSALGGVRGDELLVRIAAKPQDGAANEELCAFLSRCFQVSKSQVEVVRGHTSRHKAVLIRGDVQRLLQHINPFLVPEKHTQD